MVEVLRERGAERFDPVRFRFIEALARRVDACQGDARCLLEEKLAKAVADYCERFERAQGEAKSLVGRLSERFPDAVQDLERLCDSGDFRSLHQAAANLEGQQGRGPLADLADHLARLTPEKAGSASVPVGRVGNGPRAELKSISYFRDTWSRLSVDQQLAQALAQAPENAGPLNSHLLVLQSLKLMRDISPDYLNRFISYVDALLWLEQANGTGNTTAKNVVAGEAEKKRRSGRARSV